MADSECMCVNVSKQECPYCLTKLFPFYNVDIDKNSEVELPKCSVAQMDRFDFIENECDIQDWEMDFDVDYNLYGNFNLDCVYQETEALRNLESKEAKLLCLNIRSAPKNLEQLKLAQVLLEPVLESCPVISLTETWFNADTANLYFLNGFYGFHVYRPSCRRGGGVSIYVNASYTATYIKNISFCRPHIEAVFVKLSKEMVIGCHKVATR